MEPSAHPPASASGAPSCFTSRVPAKVLVTGANGFIGSNLCALLAQDSGYEVMGLVRPSADLSFLAGLDEVKIVGGDITDRRSLVAAMRGVSIVYHLAGLVADWGRLEDFLAANVDGAANVLAAARENGVRRLVHLSSVSVYGFPGGTNLDETAPISSRSDHAYIRSKAAGDRLAMEANSQGIETTVIRPATVYGPHDRTTTLPLAEALERGRFAYVDQGRHLMAPIHVANLVDLIRLAGESPAAPGQAFNAVDDGLMTWRQFIEWLCKDLGCAPPRLSLPRAVAWPIAAGIEAAARAVRTRKSPFVNRFRLSAVCQDNHYSTEKAKNMLGWRPSLSTREGIRQAARWCLDLAGRGADQECPAVRP